MAKAGKKTPPQTPDKETVLRDYTLIRPFSNTDSGFARWTFARKGGKDFFIKEFLSPVCPRPADVSPERYKRSRAICDAYYQKKFRLYEAINASSTGNIVTVSEFFFHDTRFYITTEKIDTLNCSVGEIAGMNDGVKILLMKVLASCLKRLHENNVVHADLKSSNILVKRTGSGSLTAKLIDFDASYLVGEQPQGEEIQGDQIYLAPETCRAIFGEDVKLTQKADVFALGVLFHQYLTGQPPQFPKQYQYAHEALLDGAALRNDPRIPPALDGILYGMLYADPEKRLSMAEVYEALQVVSPVAARRPVASAPARSTTSAGPAPVRPPTPARPAAPVRPAAPAASALRASASLPRSAAPGGYPPPPAPKPAVPAPKPAVPVPQPAAPAPKAYPPVPPVSGEPTGSRLRMGTFAKKD